MGTRIYLTPVFEDFLPIKIFLEKIDRKNIPYDRVVKGGMRNVHRF